MLEAALSRFEIDTLKDLQYVQLGNIGHGYPGPQAGAVDALIAGAPRLIFFARRLGFKQILDIAAHEDSFCGHGSRSARETVERKHSELGEVHAGVCRSDALFSTNAEGTAQIVAKYTKVEDRELNTHAIESESKAMERTLQVDPKGIELILQLIGKTVPQAASARAEDFYDARFYTELRDSGFLKRLWGEKP